MKSELAVSGEVLQAAEQGIEARSRGVVEFGQRRLLGVVEASWRVTRHAVVEVVVKTAYLQVPSVSSDPAALLITYPAKDVQGKDQLLGFVADPVVLWLGEASPWEATGALDRPFGKNASQLFTYRDIASRVAGLVVAGPSEHYVVPLAGAEVELRNLAVTMGFL